jgi:hypothetical protein
VFRFTIAAQCNRAYTNANGKMAGAPGNRRSSMEGMYEKSTAERATQDRKAPSDRRKPDIDDNRSVGAGRFTSAGWRYTRRSRNCGRSRCKHGIIY